VVDRDAEIGDLRAVAPDHLGQAGGAADALWMQDVALGEQGRTFLPAESRAEVPVVRAYMNVSQIALSDARAS
jgi:hypothetical protein